MMPTDTASPNHCQRSGTWIDATSNPPNVTINTWSRRDRRKKKISSRKEWPHRYHNVLYGLPYTNTARPQPIDIPPKEYQFDRNLQIFIECIFLDFPPHVPPTVHNHLLQNKFPAHFRRLLRNYESHIRSTAFLQWHDKLSST